MPIHVTVFPVSNFESSKRTLRHCCYHSHHCQPHSTALSSAATSRTVQLLLLRHMAVNTTATDVNATYTLCFYHPLEVEKLHILFSLGLLFPCPSTLRTQVYVLVASLLDPSRAKHNCLIRIFSSDLKVTVCPWASSGGVLSKELVDPRGQQPSFWQLYLQRHVKILVNAIRAQVGIPGPVG